MEGNLVMCCETRWGDRILQGTVEWDGGLNITRDHGWDGGPNIAGDHGMGWGTDYCKGPWNGMGDRILQGTMEWDGDQILQGGVYFCNGWSGGKSIITLNHLSCDRSKGGLPPPQQ